MPGTAPEPAVEPVPETAREFSALVADPAGAPALATDTGRRVVVRLLGGDEVELGTFVGSDEAVEAAQELVARFSTAEASGEWPEIEGRFLRPASIASIDVLVQA